ncbi:hypothetical protein ABTM32_21655, partial [Acinetobacter baumannii]
LLAGALWARERERGASSPRAAARALLALRPYAAGVFAALAYRAAASAWWQPSPKAVGFSWSHLGALYAAALRCAVEPAILLARARPALAG